MSENQKCPKWACADEADYQPKRLQSVAMETINKANKTLGTHKPTQQPTVRQKTKTTDPGRQLSCGTGSGFSLILTSSSMYRQMDPELLSKTAKDFTKQWHNYPEHLSAGTNAVYMTTTLTEEIRSCSFLLATVQIDQTGP